MTTSRKLWLGFGTLTFLLVLVCVAILVRLSFIKDQVNQMATVARQRSATVREMEVDAVEFAVAVHEYLHSGDPRAKRDAVENSTAVEHQRAAYARLALSELQRDMAAEFITLWEPLRELGLGMLDIENRQPPQSDLIRFNELRAQLDQFVDDEMQEDASDVYRRRRDATVQGVQTLEGFTLFLLCVGTLIAVVTSTTFARAVIRGERAIADHNERLRTTLASIGDAVITTDTQGHVTNLNPVAETLTGWENSAAVGRPLEEVFHIVSEETDQRVPSPAERALREGVVVGLANDTVLIAKNGSRQPVDDSAAPIRAKNGHVVGCVLVFRDVTERRKQEIAQQERSKLMALRADVSTALMAAAPAADVLQKCCEALVTHLDMAFARIWILNSSDETLELQASAGQYTHLDGGHHRIKLGEFQVGRVAEARRPHVTNDVLHDPNISHAHWAHQEGMVAFAGYPLMIEDRVLGVMAMFARKPLSEGLVADLAPLAEGIAQFIDRKEVESRRHEVELRYRLIGQAANDALWDWNLLTDEVTWNEGLEIRFGYKLEDIGHTAEWWKEHLHPDDRQRVETSIQTAIDSGAANWQAEYRFRRSDGSYAAVLDRGRVVHNTQGNAIRMVGSMFDLTERMHAAEQLQQSEERLRMAVEAADLGTWDYNPITGEMQWSQRCKQMFGLPPDAAITYDVFIERLHPDDRERTQAVVQHALDPDSGGHYECEYRAVWPDGTVRWVIAKGHGFVQGQGEQRRTVRFIGTTLDITARKQAEEEIRQSEEKFRNLADSISQFAWMADEKGSVFWYNQRWFDYTGTTLEEMRGWGWKKVHHPDHLDRVIKRLQHSWDTGEPWDDTFPLRGKDGNYRWFLSRALPIHDSNGRIVRWFGTNTDVTDQMELQEELREVAARLSEADRRKDEFLATLAHELRNPLAPIRTGLEIMKMSQNDPATLEEVRGTMERQTQQLIALVNDLLEVSRITRGKLELRPTTVTLVDVVQSAVEASRPFIDEAGHDLRVKVPSESICLHADPHRLAQVISNLLNNAAKYTPDGGRIELTVQPADGEVVISVRDTGIGIPADMLERIFEMFTQIDRPLEKSYTGLGIGLTLVKSLVEMHGGSIEVESLGERQGSEFRVRLPRLHESQAAVPDIDKPQRRAAQAGGRRVLVVDDNQAAAEMLSLVVKMLGNEVRTASDGKQAVQQAAEFMPDVVLMDIGMPRMNGYEAAQRIRNEPWGQDMLLVALTGWGQDEDKRRTREAGFDYHLTKPADPSELQRLLANGE